MSERLSLTFDEEMSLIEENASPSLVEGVKELHREYYEPRDTGYWRPLSVSWRNMGPYGGDRDNTIEFGGKGNGGNRGNKGNKGNVVVGVCAPNMYGKSTISDIILLALFGEDAPRGLSILSEGSSHGYVALKVLRRCSEGEEVYEIRRELTAKEGVVECKTDLTSGERILNRESEWGTQRVIEGYFGTLDRLQKANMITTYSPSVLMDMGWRKALFGYFSEVCDIEHYEDCVIQCRGDLRVIRGELERLTEKARRGTCDASEESVKEWILGCKSRLGGLTTQLGDLRKRRITSDTSEGQLDYEISLTEEMREEGVRELLEYERVLGIINKAAFRERRLSELRLKLKVHEEYERLFSRGSIPLRLLSERLESFVGKANEVFSRHTKYELSYKATRYGMLEFPITRTGYVTNALGLSGYERLMLRIAMCKATMEISKSRGAGLLIVDESLDCIDQGLFGDKVSDICDVIREHFGVAILMSHRDIPSSATNQKICVSRGDGNSFVE